MFIFEPCAKCGEPATEYDPHLMACFCQECAMSLAESWWEHLSDSDKLDAAGFESILNYGRRGA